MKRYLSILFILLLIFTSFAVAEEENLIRNGDFSKLDGAGMPEDWGRGMWITDAGVSNLFVDEGVEGSCVAIVNADANDARWEQTISVKPNSLYRISAKIRAEGCGNENYGATISFAGTFSYSESVLETNGEWKEITVYGRTGSKQKELTVMLRIGGYSSLNTGRAWFDDVSCVKVDSVPDGIEPLSLEVPESSNNASTETTTESDEDPARNTEAFLLLILLYGVLVLALTRKSYWLKRDSLKLDTRTVMTVGLIIAAVVRIIMAVKVRGYSVDLGCFSAWSERMFSVGIGEFYAADYFCDYPPGYMLMLWIPAAIRNLLGAEFMGTLYIFLLKLIPIICDLLSAALIYRYADKNGMNRKIAAGFALLFAFNPAVLVNSAAWGQIDAVFTLFVVICAIMASEEKYVLSLVSFAVAMLVKPQAMLFAPIGLFAIIVNLIRAKDKKKTIRFLIGVAAALGTIYLFGFAFYVGKAQNFGDAIVGPVSWLINLYGNTMGSYAYLTINALNLYDLLNLNWAAVDQQKSLTIFAWVMFALSYLYSMLLYVKSGEKKRLMLIGGTLIALIFAFGPMIHERYIYPAILLLAIAYIVDRDKRILIALTVITCTTAMNEILVLQGGMGSGNYGHLHSQEQWLNAIVSAVNVLNALFLVWTSGDICGIFTGESHVMPLKSTTGEVIPIKENTDHKLHLIKSEIAVMLVVTVLYSCVAFTNLGVTKAPQTSWVSSQAGESITFDLGEVTEHRMIYYGGICNSTFTVELSNDGETWTEPYYAQYDQGEIFKWIYYIPRNEEKTVVYQENQPSVNGEAVVTFATSDDQHPFQTARYVRITAEAAGLTLSEVGFWTRDSRLIQVIEIKRTGALEGFETNATLLVDEQDTVAEVPSYLNSMYFDEIYHARTAYELLHGLSVYEWTHPPLGKVLMMVGVAIFGMTPFGWRFMGTFVGVLMLPLMYLLVKQLTKSKALSFIAMLMLALDSMHFTQTRIATIDSYAVFWIMLEYLLMFRFVQMDWRKVSMRESLITLGACGITMGIACATKWIGIYAAVGLAILFFWKIISEYTGNKDMRTTYTKRIIRTCLFCVAFFVVIPILIYYFSHFRQLRYEGVVTMFDMLKPRWIKRVVELQKSMFSYHSGLGGDTHYFRSPWYQWPVIWWPMWYYSGTEYMPSDTISSISCMGNPAVWWFGLVALIFILIASAWKRKTPLAWWVVLLGFASQFLPWVLVPRSTFIYHYFASVPFIIICSVLLLAEVRKKNPKVFNISAGALLGLALILFVAFYPLESGLPATRAYAQYLRWFKWYNF